MYHLPLITSYASCSKPHVAEPSPKKSPDPSRGQYDTYTYVQLHPFVGARARGEATGLEGQVTCRRTRVRRRLISHVYGVWNRRRAKVSLSLTPLLVINSPRAKADLIRTLVGAAGDEDVVVGRNSS